MKVEFEGSAPNRNMEFYTVLSVPITVKKVKRPDYSKFEIDVEKDLVDDYEFICTCKFHSTNPESKKVCKYIKYLKEYLSRRQNEMRKV